MNRTARNPKVVIAMVSALCMLALAGCSSTPPPESAGLKQAELTFDINTCQQLGAGLYKCPAVDKPICSPDYVGDNSIECVHVGKNGSVLVQQMQ
jgi:hypothetical protein